MPNKTFTVPSVVTVPLGAPSQPGRHAKQRAARWCEQGGPDPKTFGAGLAGAGAQQRNSDVI